MNAAKTRYADQEVDYQEVSFKRSAPAKFQSKSNQGDFGRRTKPPKSYNGIHRRRRRRIQW